MGTVSVKRKREMNVTIILSDVYSTYIKPKICKKSATSKTLGLKNDKNCETMTFINKKKRHSPNSFCFPKECFLKKTTRNFLVIHFFNKSNKHNRGWNSMLMSALMKILQKYEMMWQNPDKSLEWFHKCC